MLQHFRFKHTQVFQTSGNFCYISLIGQILLLKWTCRIYIILVIIFFLNTTELTLPYSWDLHDIVSFLPHAVLVITDFFKYFRVLKVTQDVKSKSKPQALNTIEMLRAASSGLGMSLVFIIWQVLRSNCSVRPSVCLSVSTFCGMQYLKFPWVNFHEFYI